MLKTVKKTAQEFKSSWSDSNFWSKLGGDVKAIGHNATYNALLLYLAAKSPDTPNWVRTIMWGTLGYFISIVDFIPDLTPIFGYTDDISLMIAAISTLAAHISPEMKEEAQRRTDTLFKK